MKKEKISFPNLPKHVIGDQSAQGIALGSGCAPDADVILQAVKVALGKDCAIRKDEAQVAAHKLTRNALPYSKSKPLSESFAHRYSMPLIVPISNSNLFTEDIPAGAQIGLSVLFSHPVLPRESDVRNQSLSAVSGANAGSGIVGTLQPKPWADGDTIDGIATDFPTFGYIVRVQWAASDIATDLAIKIGSNIFMYIKPGDDDCREAWCFVPSVSASPFVDNGKVTYGYEKNATPVTFSFVVQEDGADDTAIGAWTVEYAPIPLTQELLAAVLPQWNGRKFTR